MSIQPIAYSYWRTIKRGSRAFKRIPDNVKADVRRLAQTDAQNGVITEEKYKHYIGEDYPAAE